MLRALFAFGAFLTFTVSKAQVEDICGALDAVLSYSPANRVYYLDKLPAYKIIFHDTSGAFKGCSLNAHYSRNVEIDNIIPPGKFTASDFVILFEKQTYRTMEFILVYPHNGARCTFMLKKRRKGYRMKKFIVAFT
jgi:hypothetical protein